MTTEVAYSMAIVLKSLRAANIEYYGVESKCATSVIDLFDIAHKLAVEKLLVSKGRVVALGPTQPLTNTTPSQLQ